MKRSRYGILCSLLIYQLMIVSVSSAQDISEMIDLETQLTVTNAESINSKNLESSPVFYEDGIVFVYAREKSRLIDPKIGMPYFELMYSALSPDGQPRRAVSFSPNIRSRYHEGACCFSNDFQNMYFTRSNFKNGKGIADGDKKIRLKIFESKKGLEDWEEIRELPFCSDSYSVCHPAVSEDGLTMVFSSDLPGGEGGMDLYVVEREGDSWGIPRNLGLEINTSQNEVFPVLNDNGVLFFSSNGHDGLGGLDIYATHLSQGKTNGLLNMPAPFNSRQDDLGLVIDRTGTFGLLASEREGKKRKDDIYLLSMSKDIFEMPMLSEPVIADTDPTIEEDSLVTPPIEPITPPCMNTRSRIRSYATDEPMQNALVTYIGSCLDEPVVVQTDEKGFVEVCLRKNCSYDVVVEKVGYQDHKYQFIMDASVVAPWNIFLKPLDVLTKGLETIETGTTIVLENIYYDFNKSAIQKGAAEELTALAELMKQYPSMQIELAAHTDSRGEDSYNLELSERRAWAAKDFLVARGIKANRITIEAKGESEIRNPCLNGVPCSEEQHRYNRRTEVKVLKIDAPVQIQYGDGQWE